MPMKPQIPAALAALALLAAPHLVHEERGDPDDSQAAVYFSPTGGCQAAILAEIEGAKKSISVAMYTFTDGSLAEALVKRSMDGIEVRVLLDDRAAGSSYSKARNLTGEESEVRLARHRAVGLDDDDFSVPPHFHHKFCIVDEKTVITGSYNWTWGAETRNNEDLLVLEIPDLARRYSEHFEKLWTNASPGEDPRREQRIQPGSQPGKDPGNGRPRGE